MVTLILIVCYFLLVFCLKWGEEIFSSGYGFDVLLRVLGVASLTVAFFAFPIAALVIALTYSRVSETEPGRMGKYFVAFVIVVGIAGFWWSAYQNPHLNKKLTSLLYDIRQNVPSEDIGKSDSLMTGYTLMTLDELETERDTKFQEIEREREKLIKELLEHSPIAQLDSLLQEPESDIVFIHRTDFDRSYVSAYMARPYQAQLTQLRVSADIIQTHFGVMARCSYEVKKMWMYPLLLMLLVLLGKMAGPFTRKAHLGVVLMAVYVVFFPAYTYGFAIAQSLAMNGYIRVSQHLWIMPALLFAASAVLFIIIRKKRQRDAPAEQEDDSEYEEDDSESLDTEPGTDEPGTN